GVEIGERRRPLRPPRRNDEHHDRPGIDARVGARGVELRTQAVEVEHEPRLANRGYRLPGYPRAVGKLPHLLVAAAALHGFAATAATAGGAMPASAPCTGAALTGTFKVIPGSAGAGNVVYRLRVANGGRAACFVTGLPGVTLLDASGRKLPTSASFVGRPGMLTAVMVALAPGRGTATLTPRLSPHAPGPREAAPGPHRQRTPPKPRVTPPGRGPRRRAPPR